jgi:hypothetical protein
LNPCFMATSMKRFDDSEQLSLYLLPKFAHSDA